MALSKTQLEDQARSVVKGLLRKCVGLRGLKRNLAFVPKDVTLWNLSLALVGRAEMTRLNRKYRGKATPTDVLSFPAPEVFVREGILGDLVICVPVMRAQAKALQHSEGDELKVLIVHGFLHLLGFDHEKSASQAAVMRRWEDRLLGPRIQRRNSSLIARAASAKTKA